MEKEILKELSKKYCKREELLLIFIKICKDNNINNYKKYIEKYLNNLLNLDFR